MVFTRTINEFSQNPVCNEDFFFSINIFMKKRNKNKELTIILFGWQAVRVFNEEKRIYLLKLMKMFAVHFLAVFWMNLLMGTSVFIFS